MDIKEILGSGLSPEQTMQQLKAKTITVAPWSDLVKEYDPAKHSIMDTAHYPDIVSPDGVTPVTRVSLDFQRLAARRMSELVCGIPVKRVYKPENEQQQYVAEVMEKVYDRSRIDSVNTDRLNALFAGCEIMTMWYAVDSPNTLYGVESSIKLRCRTFTPMEGDELYPLFDEFGDMIAMSVAYTKTVGKKNVNYFDAYTADRHIKFSTESGAWSVTEDEPIVLGKIPCIYAFRKTPIWEETSSTVNEMEWALSRNGNYIRENSRPAFVITCPDVIDYGNAPTGDKEAARAQSDPKRGGGFKDVLQLPAGAKAEFVTWSQAVENLKYHVETLRSLFFTQLQLPDWSYEKMSQQALSGESRKQMFIDSQLKVKDESGRILEAFDRESNVIKAYLKIILGESYAKDIDALPVKHVITPFTITDAADTVNILMAATGGEPIMSQREAIEEFGHSEDVDKTLAEIQEQKQAAVDAFAQSVTE